MTGPAEEDDDDAQAEREQDRWMHDDVSGVVCPLQLSPHSPVAASVAASLFIFHRRRLSLSLSLSLSFAAHARTLF